jgi:hypothetical protein
MIKEIEVIKPDIMIDAKISGAFYMRLQNLLFFLLSQKDEKSVTEALSKLDPTKPVETGDGYVQALETVLVLITSLEENAKTQGLVSKEQIEIKEE